MEFAFIIHMGGDANTAKSPLTGAFANPASKANCPEVCTVSLLANGCDDPVYNAFGYHFALAHYEIFWFTFFYPLFCGQARLSPP